MFFPEPEIFIQQSLTRPLHLPQSKIRELKRHLRQGVLAPLRISLIQFPKLPREHALRPSIRDDMVESAQQNVVFLGQLKQLHPQHRTKGQIEWLTPFLVQEGHYLPLPDRKSVV